MAVHRGRDDLAARLVRAQFLSLREKEFVEAARALGASPTRQVVRHILPNSLTPVITFLFFEIALKIALPKGFTDELFYPIYDLFY